MTKVLLERYLGKGLRLPHKPILGLGPDTHTISEKYPVMAHDESLLHFAMYTGGGGYRR